MTWSILMFFAVAAQAMGAGFFAHGYKYDDKGRGLPGAVLMLTAPFLFYAAGAI